ncbi:MAG: elongation factor P [Candidatus Omnitrophota bacterium]
MALSINELKTGFTILIDGQVFLILETQHVKPGKGSAFVRTKLKNIKTGFVLDKTFRSEEVEEAYLEQRKLQYLYPSVNHYVFLDQESFEEVHVSQDALKEKIKFLKDNIEVVAYSYKDEILNVDLPNSIEVKIIETEPGIRGDTAKSGNKSAKIETGAIIQVPLFINIGDTIKIDTRTGEYTERTSSV